MAATATMEVEATALICQVLTELIVLEGREQAKIKMDGNRGDCLTVTLSMKRRQETTRRLPVATVSMLANPRIPSIKVHRPDSKSIVAPELRV